MDIIYEIRRRHSVQKQSVSTIAREMGLSRPTVRKHLNTIEEPKYERKQPASPRLGQFEGQLTAWLTDEAKLPRQRRRTAHRLFEGLQEIGYLGAYDSVQRFVKGWKSSHTGPKPTEAFVPMAFQPGDACQFDWSQEQVELGGIVQTIKGSSQKTIWTLPDCQRFLLYSSKQDKAAALYPALFAGYSPAGPDGFSLTCSSFGKRTFEVWFSDQV